MTTQRFFHRFISLFFGVILTLGGLPPATALGSSTPASPPSQDRGPVAPANSGLYRTTVAVSGPSRWQRLEALGVVILERQEDTGVVLADDEQLEALARLRFEPQASDELAALLAGQGPERAWLQASLQPLVTQGAALQALLDDKAAVGEAVQSARQSLRSAMHSITPEQRAGMASSSSLDDDDDGLTNTQEVWWCTDPMNPDSDGDGVSDGDEVAALLDWMANRLPGPPVSGKPFGGWPPLTTSAGYPGRTFVCQDDDRDSVPDLAERWMLGLYMNRESTDLDKFDDGQELFGFTNCPGGDQNCGYGDLPRSSDSGYVGSIMPSWVRAPGNHPLVAAFPVPEVDVTPGSWRVARATIITTTEGQMTQTEHSYQTSVTEGQSTGIADTVTWNNWEEVSHAIETPGNLSLQIRRTNWCGENCQFLLMTFGSFLSGGAVDFGSLDQAVSARIQTQYMINDTTGPDIVQALLGVGRYTQRIADGVTTSTERLAEINSSLHDGFATIGTGFQSVAGTLDGIHQAIDRQGRLVAHSLYDISYQLSRPRVTETKTSGKSWGGEQTTTHEVYEEHTISQGQAFTTGQQWSTAWAVDSSHAADLTFEFTVKNSGTEYACILTGMIVNVYIGDDTNPSISYPAWEKFPNGTIYNLFPGESHTYVSDPIALNLDQMRRIDLGERLTVVVEDFSYGADEPFYQNAINGGMTIYIEDGIEDGDETVDMYVIPTWDNESVLDVLARYFPAGYDDEGNINALWTPEFDTNPPTWHEHHLSDISWWNIYLSQTGTGNTGLKDLPAQAGEAMLFRFNRDSDRDGYNDRAEFRYYCALPASNPDHVYCTDAHLRADVHPQPELLAGYVTIRSGDVVTVKLVAENTGTFDAYGIDAVMYSPNATTSIGNNTVGGNGRARPGQHVAVGSLVKAPDLGSWGANTAKPYAGGNYTGAADRTYTFTASTPGTVGQGGTTLSWSDGAGGGDTLAVGSSYHAPLPLNVADGVQIGLNTGTIMAGTSFTVQALTPRDTFTYTVESEPFTPPVIVVSYSDPRGSHRFVTPVELTNLSDPLAPHAGQMRQGLELSINATGELDTAGANTTHLVLNSPHPATIEDANLYLNFVSDGILVLEKPFTLDVSTGPTVFPAAWSVSEFSADYNPDGDNILLAFWTDSEGNIIDSAARPFSTLQEDPTAVFQMAAADETWNFGETQQGTLLTRSFTFANTGFGDLQTYVSAPPELNVTQTGSRRLPSGDATTYEITLKTANLAVGPYSGTITIRTSDPNQPAQTVQVVGTVTAAPADTPVGSVQRPLDWPATFTSGTQGQWVEFAHTLGPTPRTLHPLKVYTQDYASLKGVGKYATAFGQGTTSYDMFGDGRDGDLLVPSGQTVTLNTVRTSVSASGTSATPSNSAGFSAGDVVLFHQTQGPGSVGLWELNTITAINSANNWTLARPLAYTYASPPLGQACGEGYRGEYFNNRTLSGSPVFSRCDASLNFNWGAGSPGAGIPSDSFSVRWTVQLAFNSATNYQITTCSDDGYRVYIDGQLSINRWQDQDACYSDTRYVPAGIHSFVIEYYENGGNARFSHKMGGYARAQVIKVPQYRTATVQSGGNLTAMPWDGSTGGILSLMVADSMTVNGNVTMDGLGYRGGVGARRGDGHSGQQGESYGGIGVMCYASQCYLQRQNNGGGGGSGGEFGIHSDGGAGGGYGSNGGPPWSGGAVAGVAYGDGPMTSAFMGSGGGGAYENGNNVAGGNGGNGGGLLLLNARNLTVNGSVRSNGGNGGSTASYPGGGGSGGGIRIISGNANLGASFVAALGGIGGRNPANDWGGNGGSGRIRVEYCESIAGATNPAASSQRLSCYIIEQIESAPYDRARINLPESGSHTYQVQYGRKLDYGGAGNQVTSLRVPAGAFAIVTLESLISGAGTGALTLRVDIGNDSASSWDWEWTGNVNDAVALNSPDLASALNRYWASHGAPISGTLDVPIEVELSKAGQVLLTNLQVTPTGSRLRHVRLPAQSHSSVVVGLTAGQSGSANLTVAADVGDNGSVDWAWSGNATYPQALTTGNLATAFNAYLQGQTGDMDVPIRFYISPFVDVSLQTVSATPAGRPDLSVVAADISFSPPAPVESDAVTVTATVRNPGSLASGPLTASFFAALPSGQEWYIGSAFIPSVPPSSSSPAQIAWNTLGFTGNVPVRVVVDPYNRVVESNETNNQATKLITILTRPDLRVTAIDLSDDELVAGESVDITLTLANSGQTAAPASMLALYEGMPGNGGTLICQSTLATPANGSVNAACTWTPAAPGLHRLYAVADETSVVNESDKSNNAAWVDIYVGFAGPLLMDSGNAAADPSYTAEAGYGVVDQGLPDVLVSCGAGTAPEDTLRRDPDGRVVYRFDHLLPGHFYHLDIILRECDGVGRQESILVDGNLIDGPISLAGNQPIYRSLLLDPALYADRTITVTLEAPGIDGAVVSQVNLFDIDYRYADAGGSRDPQYPGAKGYGWLDGVASTAWGALPYQSVRVDQSDNQQRYRFDGLDPDRQYQVNMTFYQSSGPGRQQVVEIDGLPSGLSVDTGDYMVHRLTATVPLAAYVGDGSIVVTTRRTNASTGAMVNEISLEGLTQLTGPRPAIANLRVSNVSDTSFTVSWTTNVATTGYVHYGASDALGQLAYDERGSTTVDDTHHVKLENLTPGVTYQFDVLAGQAVDDNNGAHYSVTTGATLPPPGSDTIYGRVFKPDGATLAGGALVYARVCDANGQGSPGCSAWLSSLVAPANGFWYTNLGQARNEAHNAYFSYSPAGDRLELTVEGAADCRAALAVDTANDSPVADILLRCTIQAPITSNPGWNLLALPLQPVAPHTAASLLNLINSQGGQCSEIDRWRFGGWDAHIYGLPFNDFAVELGKGYFTKCAASATWILEGNALTAGVPLALQAGWNLVSVPHPPSHYTAQSLLDAIAAQGGACSEIDRWLNGGWDAHINGLPFNNFAVEPHQGYFVKCSQPSTFTPSATLAAAERAAWPEPIAPVALEPVDDVAITDVLVTNRRDVALAITWRTDRPSTGWVEYGDTPELGQVAYDDRGEKTVSAVHHVTLTGLQPEAAVYYRVHAGAALADDGGQPFVAATAARLAPSAPATAFGQITTSEGAPAVGSLALGWLVDKAGSRSEPLSALVDGWGYWVLSLPEIDCQQFELHLEIFDPSGVRTEYDRPACQ